MRANIIVLALCKYFQYISISVVDKLVLLYRKQLRLQRSKALGQMILQR